MRPTFQTGPGAPSKRSQAINKMAGERKLLQGLAAKNDIRNTSAQSMLGARK